VGRVLKDSMRSSKTFEPLRSGAFLNISLDAQKEKACDNDQVIDHAALITIEVNLEGLRDVLAVSTPASDAEVH
jgi:hypothetical protein